MLPGFIRDAGMFADSGAKAPPGLGTSSPEEVGEGVATAIERNRAEVAGGAPVAAAAAPASPTADPISPLARRAGTPLATADRVIEGQARKRRRAVRRLADRDRRITGAMMAKEVIG